tara:strand:+ start:3766 stop:5460 length:1695 start_codon:yes stop_codon:yes gene_type:complete
MAGGLLNLVAVGNQNVLLNGNPDKTFFKTKYSKYTNFGLQKFRIDFQGVKNLNLTEQSEFTFKVPRYADLLMDTYLVISLPHIWSTILPPSDTNNDWIPYEFKWIDNIGTQIIKEVQIVCGGALLQKFSGSYLMNMVERDFSKDKKDLFNKMTGNTNDLTNPELIENRNNSYPNAFYTPNQNGSAPSIYAKDLYIPINCWFTLNSKLALPLVAMQKNELEIKFIFRSIQELFTVRDVSDKINDYPRIRPNFTNNLFGMYRFLQTPPSVELNDYDYDDRRVIWNSNIHLMSTYCFLSEDERKLFAAKEQNYLIKTVYEYTFNNIVGSSKVELNTNGLISNWMFYLQRSDINLRNEWSNYTNWPYDYIPQNISLAPKELPLSYPSNVYGNDDVFINGESFDTIKLGPGYNKNGTLTNLYINPIYSNINTENILQEFAILIDGNYRENLMKSDVYNFIEKYVRTSGNSPNGLYCYNFAIHSNPFEYQPSGAINMSMFNKVELELTTIVPELDENAAVYTLRDEFGNLVGINKPSWIIYGYTYDLVLLEERYNVLTFVGGEASLMYAR